MLGLLVLVVAARHVLTASDAVLDDEAPDAAHYCVLDENGEPINCAMDADDEEVAIDDGMVRAAMQCTGTGLMGTSCRYKNLCYDGRERPYRPVSPAHLQTEHSIPHYEGTVDWLYFADDETTEVPTIGLLGHRGPTVFNANVSTALPAETDVEWIDGLTLLTFRQYHANYYHIIMDDLIGMWWTLQNHIPEEPRDFRILLLDDHKMGKIDVLSMMRMLTTGEIVTREEIHKKNQLVCFRDVIVGPAERSWGGPGRRLIKEPMLRNFHDFIRTGARNLADAARAALINDRLSAFKKEEAAVGETDETDETEDGLVKANPDNLLATDEIKKPRVSVLFRKGTRKVLNEEEVMKGLTTAFPKVEFFELRAEKMPFVHQVALMRNSTILIGVHGAGLTNHMFLPDGASLIELLPWHWERHAYGRISQVLRYHYFAWRNVDKEKTVFHESVFDGIPGVSDEDKDTIRNADSKPMKMRSPGSLAAEKYWINQDTIVNVDELIAVVREALTTGVNGELNEQSNFLGHSEL